MKDFKIAFLFAVLSISILFSACAAGNESANYSVNANANTAAYSRESIGGSPNKTANSAPAASQVSLDQANKSQTAPVVTERKIIRDAEMTLEVESPEESQNKITTIAESNGGFVIESQRKMSDAKATKTDIVAMTVRIPAARFDESLAEIRKTASRLIVEDVKGQDVTEEFIDIEARLKAQKALEAQFLEIMKQAKTVEEALNVQREIAEVRGGIEKIEGRKRFLENQSEFSTLKIRLQASTAFSPNSSGFFYELSQAFTRGFDVALGFILILLTIVIGLLPFLIFIVLPIYLVIRYFLRKSKKPPLASEVVEAEIRNG